MKALCIIPARGGSKRIPKKNIKEFLGKPVIQYSIEAALSTNVFEEVFVSTDDSEISQISEKLGAVSDRFRSKKASNDFATTVDVLIEVLGYKKYQNTQIVCCLYPVAPLIKTNNLIKAYNTILSNEFNSVIPITEFGYPPQRSVLKNKQNIISFRDPKFKNTRSQDLVKLFHDVGMFYFLRVDEFLKSKELMCQPSFGMELNRLEVQDIDTCTDWKLAELKYQLLNQEK